MSFTAAWRMMGLISGGSTGSRENIHASKGSIRYGCSIITTFLTTSEEISVHLFSPATQDPGVTVIQWDSPGIPLLPGRAWTSSPSLLPRHRTLATAGGAMI